VFIHRHQSKALNYAVSKGLPNPQSIYVFQAGTQEPYHIQIELQLHLFCMVSQFWINFGGFGYIKALAGYVD
jgi:hypothetical protein